MRHPHPGPGAKHWSLLLALALALILPAACGRVPTIGATPDDILGVIPRSGMTPVVVVMVMTRK